MVRLKPVYKKAIVLSRKERHPVNCDVIVLTGGHPAVAMGSKATWHTAAWAFLFLALAVRQGALAQPVPTNPCNPWNVGSPCTTGAGFDGVCKEITTIDSGMKITTFVCSMPACTSSSGPCDVCGAPGSCNLVAGNTNILCLAQLGDRQYMLPDTACVTPSGDAGTCQADGACQVHGGANSDPIINGFDGKSFHFDQTGEFTLLSSGDGFRVDVTFTGAATEVKEEKCWTSDVRFTAPNGDVVSCTLPAIQPNTSRVQMAVMPVAAPAHVTVLSASKPLMELAEMNATAVLSAQGLVTGCQVTTQKMQATVYQVSGYEQALLHLEEAWAAPYTWLNTDIKLTKPLPAPVTGILGSTYPMNPAAEAEFLRALEEPGGGVEAGVVGEPGSRGLAGVAGPFFLESSIVGIASS